MKDFKKIFVKTKMKHDKFFIIILLYSIMLVTILGMTYILTIKQRNKGFIGIMGDQGLKGDVGKKGLKGDQGITGDYGLKGDVGEKGEIGIGLVGNKGDKGDIGDTGIDGNHELFWRENIFDASPCANVCGTHQTPYGYCIVGYDPSTKTYRDCETFPKFPPDDLYNRTFCLCTANKID